MSYYYLNYLKILFIKELLCASQCIFGSYNLLGNTLRCVIILTVINDATVSTLVGGSRQACLKVNILIYLRNPQKTVETVLVEFIFSNSDLQIKHRFCFFVFYFSLFYFIWVRPLNMRSTFSNFLKYTIQYLNNRHIVLQQMSRTYSSYMIKTLYDY